MHHFRWVGFCWQRIKRVSALMGICSHLQMLRLVSSFRRALCDTRCGSELFFAGRRGRFDSSPTSPTPHYPLTNKGLPPLVSPKMHLLLDGHNHEFSPVTAAHPHTQFSVFAPRAKGADIDLQPTRCLSLSAPFALSHSAGRTA